MSNLSEQRLQESVFVLLHGVKAFADGEWQPILLDLVHSVEFEAESLLFEEHLVLFETISSSGGLPGVYGAREESRPIRFGVAVIWQNKINEPATYWLDDIALSIRSIRTSQIRERITHGKGPFDQMTSQELHDLQRLLSNPLNAWEAKDEFGLDPRTFDEYQNQVQAKASDLEEFSAFFRELCVQLTEIVRLSKALEPIVLSENGVTFVQSIPPGPHGKNLSDEMELCSGTHLYCGGSFSFYQISETYRHIVCDRCHWSKEYPVSTVRTFSHLRYLSPRPRHSEE